MEGEKIKLKALYDFTARVPNELTFKTGDIIYLIDKHTSGMWKGELDGTIGLFPYNYVEELASGDSAGDAEQSQPLISEGWLTKQGHIRKNWKRRWFVLKDKTLYYYEKRDSQKESGSIPLQGYTVEQADDMTQKLHTFHLYDQKDLKRKQFFIRADNAIDLKNWMKAIETAAAE